MLLIDDMYYARDTKVYTRTVIPFLIVGYLYRAIEAKRSCFSSTHDHVVESKSKSYDSLINFLVVSLYLYNIVFF